MDPFLGQIMMWGGNFAPRGWAKCDGQLLPIAQNTALFSLLGTTYGGDGRTTFALPDLRGRCPIHVGNGPGLRPSTWGQRKGKETVILTDMNLPPAKVTIPGTTEEGSSDDPSDSACATTSTDNYGDPESNTKMASGTIQGGGQPFDISPPSLGIYFCIAVVGIFPSRS